MFTLGKNDSFQHLFCIFFYLVSHCYKRWCHFSRFIAYRPEVQTGVNRYILFFVFFLLLFEWTFLLWHVINRYGTFSNVGCSFQWQQVFAEVKVQICNWRLGWRLNNAHSVSLNYTHKAKMPRTCACACVRACACFWPTSSRSTALYHLQVFPPAMFR